MVHSVVPLDASDRRPRIGLATFPAGLITASSPLGHVGQGYITHITSTIMTNNHQNKQTLSVNGSRDVTVGL